MAANAVILLAVLLLAACGAEPAKESSIPKLTVDRTLTSSEAPPPTQYPAPVLPRSPSCDLLTDDEVRSAMGSTQVQSPIGHVFSGTNTSSGVRTDVDACSWQELPGTGPTPGRGVGVEIITADSVADADKEFPAAVEHFAAETAPGFRPVAVSGLGSRASRLPAWLMAQNGKVICRVHVNLDGQGSLEPAVLENLAQRVTQRLGW